MTSISEGDLHDMISHIIGGGSHDGHSGISVSPDIEARKLLDALELFSEVRKYERGDLVVTKPGSPYNHPNTTVPGIVWNVLETPVLAETGDSTDARFLLPLDTVVGVYVKDCFVLFHMSSMYLEPYTGKIFPK